MGSRLVWGLAVVCAVFYAPVFVSASEIIDSFESDITVSKDSYVTVVETISYDFGEDARHGIFRDIPSTHPELASTWYKERYIDTEVTSVVRNDTTEKFEVTKKREGVHVRIGDPDSTITGKQVYKITYTLHGALSHPVQLPPELYMNVNGAAWEVPARVVRATLHADADMFSTQRTCYKGIVGSGSSCTIRTNEDGSVTFEATNLAPRETVTFAQAFRDGSVVAKRAERLRLDLLSLIASAVWLCGLSWFTYSYRTEHKQNRTVVAEYEPYPGILPMQMGVLKDGSLDPKDISAGIVYLAEQGYLTIKRTERKVFFVFEVTDYELTLVRRPADVVWQSELLQLMFDEHLVAGAVTTLSELKSNHTKQASNHTVIQSLEASIIEDLKKNDFYQTPLGGVSRFQKVVWGATALSFFGLFFGGMQSLAYVVMVVTLVISSGLVSFLSRRLTVKGYEALRYLHGFKEYLSVAEKDRIDFHNAPERKPEQFLAFLPYAIAFGVEKKWADAFKDITIPTPSWYDGGSAGFVAADLSSSLGGFSSALASSAGSSASSGGGSAGGGGGGGGGGSW
ncbi:MAG: hypothetical protein RLZZ234_481 [Candidatus Parcubacteria bacterium]|jgi:uncharacterized membrane protein YgcG